MAAVDWAVRVQASCALLHGAWLQEQCAGQAGTRLLPAPR